MHSKYTHVYANVSFPFISSERSRYVKGHFWPCARNSFASYNLSVYVVREQNLAF